MGKFTTYACPYKGGLDRSCFLRRSRRPPAYAGLYRKVRGVFAVAELLPHRDGVLRSFLLDAMSPRRGTARRMIDRRAVRRSTLVFRLKRVRRLRSDKNMPTNRRKHIRLVCDAARKIA